MQEKGSLFTKRENHSPQAPRIPKSREPIIHPVLQRNSVDDDKREEHNFFMRRVISI